MRAGGRLARAFVYAKILLYKPVAIHKAHLEIAQPAVANARKLSKTPVLLISGLVGILFQNADCHADEVFLYSGELCKGQQPAA